MLVIPKASPLLTGGPLRGPAPSNPIFLPTPVLPAGWDLLVPLTASSSKLRLVVEIFFFEVRRTLTVGQSLSHREVLEVQLFPLGTLESFYILFQNFGMPVGSAARAGGFLWSVLQWVGLEAESGL